MHVCMYVVVVEIVIASDYHACMHVCMYVCGGDRRGNSSSYQDRSGVIAECVIR